MIAVSRDARSSLCFWRRVVGIEELKERSGGLVGWWVSCSLMGLGFWSQEHFSLLVMLKSQFSLAKAVRF